MRKWVKPSAPVKFTDAVLGQLRKYGQAGDRITDLRCPGLAARLLRGGVTFEWRGRVKHGKVITVRLGMWLLSDGGPDLDQPRFGLLTVERARMRAAAVTAAARAGHDPRAERLAREGNSVGAALARYETDHQRHKRRGVEVMKNLRRHLEPLLDRPLTSIRKRDLLDAVTPLANAGRWSRAHRLKTDISSFMSWAEDHEIVPGFVSPARRLRLAKPAPVRSHVPSLETCRAVYQAAQHIPVRRRVFTRLLLLTGCRLSEVANLAWSEVSSDALRISAERYKSGREHTLPLTVAMRAELDLVTHTRGGSAQGLVVGPMGSFSHLKQKLMALSGTAGWTFHDFRRAFATHLANAGVEPHVIERALGHTVRGVAGIYNRARLEDQVRDALLKWEALLTSGVVIPLRRPA